MTKNEFKEMYRLLRSARAEEIASDSYSAYWMGLGFSLKAHKVVLCIVSNYEYNPMRLTKEERNMNRKLP